MSDVPAVQVRIVKPTTRWKEVTAFYEEGIGLQRLDSFTAHQGYDGLMLGLPDLGHHMEIVQRDGGAPNPNPNLDNLLVFYIQDRVAISKIVARLGGMGYHPGEAINPWWGAHDAVTIYDPDGWGVIFYPYGDPPADGGGADGGGKGDGKDGGASPAPADAVGVSTAAPADGSTAQDGGSGSAPAGGAAETNLLPWPGDVPAIQFRIVKPTTRWNDVVAFYMEGLGLQRLGEFTAHQGYDGVMLGLPGLGHHMEIVQRDGGAPNPNPNPDNLLVFYVEDPAAITTVVNRLGLMGYHVGRAINPWWGANDAVTIYDPDGWGVIFYPLTPPTTPPTTTTTAPEGAQP
jgi:hypothetical protein